MSKPFLLFDFNPPPLLLLPPRVGDVFGPFPKSVYSYQLEELVRHLLGNETFEIRKPHSLVLTKTKQVFNLEELISHANLDHISFNALDFQLYNQLVSTSDTPLFSSTLLKEQQATYQAIYPNLSFAQMQAINIYTGGAFSYMNMFLRKKAAFWDYPPAMVKATIINALMCCSALTQIPDKPIEQVFRIEDLPSDLPLYLQERVRAADMQSIINLEGFVSTSICNPINGGDILYVFSNLKGKYVQPLSQCPVENEFLIPPTQIKIMGYNTTALSEKYKRFKHCFEVSTTNELSSLPTNHLRVPNLSELITLTLNKIHYIITHSQDDELNQCLRPALTALKTVFNLTAVKDVDALSESERSSYINLLGLSDAAEAYLNEKDKQTKKSILTNTIKPLINQNTWLQPSFTMRILSSIYVNPLAFTLIILGLGGIIIGTLGLTGVIGLGCIASITLIGGGSSCVAMGSGILAYNFFKDKALMPESVDGNASYNTQPC